MTIKNRAAFAEFAAPEAIAAYLKKAKDNAAKANREVEWLSTLLAKRTEQVAAGTWPPTAETTQP